MRRMMRKDSMVILVFCMTIFVVFALGVRCSSAADGNVDVSLSKYVQKIDEDGDEYDLSLVLKGSRAESVDMSKLNILYVIDTTGSMLWSMDAEADGYTTTKERWNEIANGIKSADTYINANSIDAEYAVVSFAAGSTGFKDAQLEIDWTSNSATVENGLRDLEGYLGGGTNYEAPFYTIQTSGLLDRARSDAKTVIIFVSDGEPNEYYDAIGFDIFDGYGSDALNAATERLSRIGGYDAFYAIGVGNDIGEAVLAQLSDSASVTTKGAYHCTQKDEMQAALLEIITTHTVREITNVSIEDILSEYAVEAADTKIRITVSDVKGDVASGEGDLADGAICELPETELNGKTSLVATYDRDTKKLKLVFPKEYIIDPDLEYKTTITIKPTELAYSEYKASGYSDIGEETTGETSSGQKGFHSNKEGSAVANYVVTDEGSKTTEYPMPVIQVTAKDVAQSGQTTPPDKHTSDTQIEQETKTKKPEPVPIKRTSTEKLQKIVKTGDGFDMMMCLAAVIVSLLFIAAAVSSNKKKDTL